MAFDAARELPEAAKAIGKELFLEPPGEALGEPFRTILRTAADALAKGVSAESIVRHVEVAAPAPGAAPASPLRKYVRR